MRISYTPQQEELRRELRSYFATLMTPERREALSSVQGEYGVGNVYRETIAQMGRDGWLALGWPKEYGGQGRSAMDQLIFTDEAAIAGAPVPFLTINSVAPTIMAYGTDEQKRFFLPRIAAGDLHFSIGYSEPGAGTDLANLRTTAVRDGDDYVVNGQKMWTSLIQYADYVWLAVRTNPESSGAKKHRGISGAAVFLVAAGDPGVAVTALATTGLGSVGHLELNGAKVDAARRVGGTDVAVWLGTLSTLSRTAFQLGVLERGLQMTAEYARTREQFDRPIGSFQAVGQRLADGYIDVKGLRLTLTQAAWRVAEDSLASRECPQPADIDVATAGFWAAEAGHRVAHTIVHVHGGVGVDTDHPVHRYFLAAKQTEFALGGATGQLRRIGRELAETPA